MRLGRVVGLVLAFLALPAVAAETAESLRIAPAADAYTALYEREVVIFTGEKGLKRDEALRAFIPEYEALAANNDTRAMFRLANIAQQLGDQDAMFRALRRMAELGDAKGQYYLASTLRRLPDCSEARQWLTKSAEQGFESAVSGLAFYYENGICGPIDNVQAAFWYEKGARMGMGVAQNNLGFMYLNGLGVKRNLIEAYAWFTLASRQAFEPNDRFADWHPSDARDFASNVQGRLSEDQLPVARARVAQLCKEDQVCSRIKN